MKTRTFALVTLALFGLAILFSLAFRRHYTTPTNPSKWTKLAEVPEEHGIYWIPYSDLENRGFLVYSKDWYNSTMIYLPTAYN